MSTLNEAQERAVTTTDGPVLIVAGAGAGKTRVITHRILNLIKNGVSPQSILAITFTNKAAKEMREKVYDLLNNEKTLNLPVSMKERPFVSTFHALGVHIIRENAHLLGLTRHFTIFDRSDSRRVIKQSMEQCSIDPKKFDPGTVLNMISRSKGDGVNCAEYTEHEKGYTEDVVAQVWEKYEAILNKEKALDFDDLLLKTVNLLANNEKVRNHYSSIWKYIHVDEYQDTNKVQYKIVKHLTSANHNICVVGDADQNIYSWRGATIENILNFEKDYPEATIITLEKNYRSTKNILAAANNVIEKNRMRKKKTLYTDNESGDKIPLIASYTENDEARTIADTARSLIDSGTPARNIAVLYRTNFQSRVIEESFIKKNIPYQLVGVRFFERKEIKDVLSYIKASLNKDSWSDIGRIINIPPRGIGKATVAKIMSEQENLLPPAMKIKIAQFWKLLEDIRKEIMEKKPSESVRFVIQETGMERLLREGDSEDEERLLNIRELVSVATQYDHMTPEEGMEALLSNAALATDQDELTKDEDAVKLMTVHASKGLEFEHVFIAGMEQDLFPFKHVDEENVSQAEEEEERRLFYVALTRAKKKVYLSYCLIRTVYGAQRVNTPSEFIEDIAKDLIEDAPSEKPTGVKAIFIDF
ncbi:MAG: UvrD-helicase domain-containing protein [Candidatus Paceibacterota bacterium]|jgi:DNA helicase-2/ATP-dependent DNA helicase PcrA